MLDKITEYISDQPEILFATAFGSLVNGRLTSTSDVDIAIAGEGRFDFEARLRIMDELGQIVLRDVDLIDLNTVSGPILSQALCSGVIIKKQSTVLYANLMKKLWYNQADMMPNIVMCMKAHSQRFLNG